MPRKLFRRWLPPVHKLSEKKTLRWLGPVIKDPYLFHLNRRSVSIAFFIGIFCAFLPLPGQTIIAACLALLFRCNLPLSLLLIWISNPITFAPIFIITHEFGSWLLNSPPVDFQVQLSWQWFGQQGMHILWPLLLGSVLCGLVFGGLGYLSIQGFWRWSVTKNWKERKLKRLLKKQQK